MDKDSHKKILETKMDRREFLRYVSLITIGLVGIHHFLEFFQKPLEKLNSKQVDSKTGGYGSSPYGK
jgi:cytochrome c biogenesis protein CcdA